MSQNNNLQDTMLEQVTQEKVPVTLFLMNGFQMRGSITGFDGQVVVLVTDGRQQMVYKHAISTMVPAHSLRLNTLA